jgi:SAM-dependent methyltransferase
MSIDYNHSLNIHGLEGPRKAFSKIFEAGLPGSVLDVGCGEGTWMKAAMDAGVQDILGIDGVAIPDANLLVPSTFFRCLDLTQPCNLGRKFDVAICLEVCEHIDEKFAGNLISNLINHSDRVLFSAACPNQPGQHHVNCQWPEYWQRLFNEQGFSCNDSVRWKIWDITEVEPWYKQNVFVAERCSDAGKEPRIRPVIHPEMVYWLAAPTLQSQVLDRIEKGGMRPMWYLLTCVNAGIHKVKRLFGS